jgi:hypothetical protein
MMLVPGQDRISFFFAGIAIGRLLAVFSFGLLRKLSESSEQIPFVLGCLPGLVLKLHKYKASIYPLSLAIAAKAS